MLEEALASCDAVAAQLQRLHPMLEEVVHVRAVLRDELLAKELDRERVRRLWRARIDGLSVCRRARGRGE